jgi:YD repeat-containing protein
VTAVTTKDNSGAMTNTVVSSATWRHFGPLKGLTFGNSLDLTLTYDNDGRVTDIDAAGSGTTAQDLHYGYDAASNITSIADALNTNRNQTFAYDNLNRLTSASGLYGTNTYSYDSVGNRTQKTVTVPFSSTDTYTNASTSNRLNSIAGGTSRSLTYEASGQAATDQRSPVDAWTYITDRAGRMTEAKHNTVSQATFAYDADELRIRKTKASTGDVTCQLENWGQSRLMPIRRLSLRSPRMRRSDGSTLR